MGSLEAALHGNGLNEGYIISGPSALNEPKFKEHCLAFASELNLDIQASSRDTRALVFMKIAREQALAG